MSEQKFVTVSQSSSLDFADIANAHNECLRRCISELTDSGKAPARVLVQAVSSVKVADRIIISYVAVAETEKRVAS